MDELKGKTAVVTGSTSGIGLAIAVELASKGVDIVLNGFGSIDQIDSAKMKIRDKGRDVVHMPLDLSDGDQAEALITQSYAWKGRLDILVNNAGIQHVAPVESFPLEKWDQILAVVLTSSFRAIRAAVPLMKQANAGRIINIASAHGLVASPFKSAYVAAKHGLVGLTKTVALELADTPITVNAVCPGYVRTPLVESQIADQAKVHDMSVEQVIEQVILASQPSKKFVELSDLAAFIVFLCSDSSKGITGAALSIDGGWTAR